MAWTRSLLIIGFFQAVMLTGCTNDGSGQPVSPKIDMSKKRVPHEVKIEDLKFPEHFPKQVGLVASTKIYEQDSDRIVVTWDSRLTPKEVRDHYVVEFEKLGFGTEVKEPKGMLGENYEVRAHDKKHNIWHCVGVGKQRPESQVSCFIYSMTQKEVDEQNSREQKTGTSTKAEEKQSK